MKTIRTLAIALAVAAAGALDVEAAGYKKTCASDMKVVEKMLKTATPEGEVQAKAWARSLRRAKKMQAAGKYKGCARVLRNMKESVGANR